MSENIFHEAGNSPEERDRSLGSFETTKKANKKSIEQQCTVDTGTEEQIATTYAIIFVDDENGQALLLQWRTEQNISFVHDIWYVRSRSYWACGLYCARRCLVGSSYSAPTSSKDVMIGPTYTRYWVLVRVLEKTTTIGPTDAIMRFSANIAYILPVVLSTTVQLENVCRSCDCPVYWWATPMQGSCIPVSIRYQVSFPKYCE